MDWLKSLNPTLLLFGAIAFVFLANLAGSFAVDQTWYFHLPFFCVQAFLVFIGFTVIHDASHFSVSRKRWINNATMLFIWPMFVFNPFFFRRIHLEHHARTNDGKMDPDHFTASPRLAGRIIRSFFLIFYYHYYALKHFKHPRWRRHTLLSMSGPVFLIVLALTTPFPSTFLVAWLLPLFFSVGLLAYVNTAWPHHPARETATYRNTRNTYLPWSLQLLMLNQNLHLVHHLKPNLPWYKYPDYLARHEAELMRQGAQTIQYTHRRRPYEPFPELLTDWAQQAKSVLQSYWP